MYISWKTIGLNGLVTPCVYMYYLESYHFDTCPNGWMHQEQQVKRALRFVGIKVVILVFWLITIAVDGPMSRLKRQMQT